MHKDNQNVYDIANIECINQRHEAEVLRLDKHCHLDSLPDKLSLWRVPWNERSMCH